MTTTHLFTVWDPSHTDDVMGEHIGLLLHALQARSDGDDAYVWWGRLRSPHRLDPLPHLNDILALDEQAERGETHLYLTDYRSLYVAHVAEITVDDPRRDDTGHVPAYYRNARPPKVADCWFRLWDIRRLVADDTVAVAAQVRHLKNTRYHHNAVSLYGGIIDLPLLVQRDEEAPFFDPQTEELQIGGRRWVQFDAELTGTGAMERDLRQNIVGEATWASLDPASRTFLATAEGLFRPHRDDPAFDFSPVLMNIAKAVEVEVNRLVRRVMKDQLPPIRCVHVDGTLKDLAGSSLSLGQLAYVISGDRERMDLIAKRCGRWFVEHLPPVLQELKDCRNPAAHSSRTDRKVVIRHRDFALGVGSHGLFDHLRDVDSMLRNPGHHHH